MIGLLLNSFLETALLQTYRQLCLPVYRMGERSRRPTLMTSSKPDHLPRVLLLNTITLGAKASAYEFWGDTIQSIEVINTCKLVWSATYFFSLFSVRFRFKYHANLMKRELQKWFYISVF